MLADSPFFVLRLISVSKAVQWANLVFSFPSVPCSNPLRNSCRPEFPDFFFFWAGPPPTLSRKIHFLFFSSPPTGRLSHGRFVTQMCLLWDSHEVFLFPFRLFRTCSKKYSWSSLMTASPPLFLFTWSPFANPSPFVYLAQPPYFVFVYFQFLLYLRPFFRPL